MSVQPDEENREEQDAEEGGVTFIAHVPVPSQKEVRRLPAEPRLDSGGPLKFREVLPAVGPGVSLPDPF